MKAESDYCCTSGNAVEVVNSIPADKEILFLPDMFLGAHVRRLTGRDEHPRVDGRVSRARRNRSREHPAPARAASRGGVPDPPRCGCSTSVLEAMSAGDIDPEGVQILSTEGMIKRPALSDADEFIVATEVGILHRLRRENPSKRFFAANERASCAYMKVTTLPKVRARSSTTSIESPFRGHRRRGRGGDRAHGGHRGAQAALVPEAKESIQGNSVRGRPRLESVPKQERRHEPKSRAARHGRSRRSPRRRSAETAAAVPAGQARWTRRSLGAHGGRRVQRPHDDRDDPLRPAGARPTIVAKERRHRGVPLALEAFRQLDPKISIRVDHRGRHDGLARGRRCSSVTGHARGLLSAERVALNFMQRLSGIATLDRAVRRGGAGHQGAHPRHAQDDAGLARAREIRGARRRRHEPPPRSLDGVLIKDNHLAALDGDVALAVTRARELAPARASRSRSSATRSSRSRRRVDGGRRHHPARQHVAREMRRRASSIAGRAIVEASGGVTLRTCARSPRRASTGSPSAR